MYEEGRIIYFDPFYFRNGGPPKPKFMLVLKIINNGTSIVTVFLTRRDNVPSSKEKAFGCIEDSKINFNCFFIPNNTQITTDDLCPPQDSHIYGADLEIYDIGFLDKTYIHEDVDYFITGNLKDEVYQQIINCLNNSGVVKRKYKRFLS